MVLSSSCKDLLVSSGSKHLHPGFAWRLFCLLDPEPLTYAVVASHLAGFAPSPASLSHMCRWWAQILLVNCSPFLSLSLCTILVYLDKYISSSWISTFLRLAWLSYALLDCLTPLRHGTTRCYVVGCIMRPDKISQKWLKTVLSMLFIGNISMQHKETRVCNAGLPTKLSTLPRGLHLDWSFDASLVGTCTLLMR